MLQVLLATAPQTVAARNVLGCLPLHEAALADHATAVQLLLDTAPALQHEPNMMGQTPLHVAAHFNRADAVRLLLSPESVWRRGHGGGLPIHWAASTDDTDPGALRLLLAADPSTAVAVDEDGDTPLAIALMIALDSGITAAAEFLLGAGPADAALAQLAQLYAQEGEPRQLSHRLFASFAASRLADGPLTEAQWAQLPRPCAGIGRALAAALACSPQQAQQVVRRLPPGDAERLRCAALCLARMQGRLRATLPPAVIDNILSAVFAA